MLNLIAFAAGLAVGYYGRAKLIALAAQLRTWWGGGNA
jgi:hypothetical protein